jgi:hypothetical protein
MTDSRVSQFLDPVVTMMGSVQNSFHDMGLMSHDPYDDERWDEEAQTPRHGSDDLETSLLSKQNGSGVSLPPMSRNNSARGQGYTRSDSKSRSPLSRQHSRSRSRSTRGQAQEVLDFLGSQGHIRRAWHQTERCRKSLAVLVLEVAGSSPGDGMKGARMVKRLV